jgi:hypothetical protein
MMRGDRWIRKFPVPVFLLVSLLVSVPGEAANLSVLPSISLDETWDSNIFNTSTDKTSDYIFRAKPALTFFIGAFHTTAKITGGFEFERYADNSQLDAATATKNFDLTVAEPFQITPNFSLMPSATFVETRDSVRRNELTQDPTQVLLTSETVVTPRSKQREYKAGLQITYLLTPNVDFSLGGSGTKREFVEPVPGTNEEDSRTITEDTSVAYRITPRLSSGFFFTSSQYSFAVSPSSRSYTGGVTAQYLLSPFHTLAWRVGASYFEQDVDASGQTSEAWSPYGNISLTYTWQFFQVALGGSYEVSGAGTFGQATKRGNMDLTLTHQFAERWWWDLAGSYQTNRSFDGQGTVDIATIYASAGMRYTAAEWASFRLSGNVVRQSSDGIEGNDVDRESVFLGIVLSKLYRFDKLY